MLNQQTIEMLRSMRLTGMVEALSEQSQQPMTDLDFEARLGLLVEREYLQRENRKLSRRLKQASLQLPTACVEDIDFSQKRNIHKSKVLELTSCNWIRNHLNLLITGPTGCGKTYLACALANKACLAGFSCKYYRLPRLWHEMKIIKAEGSYNDWLSKLTKIDVLVLDEWGLEQLDDENRRDLLEILDDRYNKLSTIITSQLPTKHWHEYLDSPTLADAILDRLVHNSITLELSGDSMRKQKKLYRTR